MELARSARSGIDVSTETEVLSWTCPAGRPREIVSRIDLGSVANPLSGAGGTYSARLYVNGAPVLPHSDVSVVIGTLRFTVTSRAVPVDPGDTISLRVVGLAGDVDVDTLSSLRNATPVEAADVAGDGSIEVDHDYGGVDALAYKTAGGQGIDNAEVRVYLAADHAAGNLSTPYVVAQTRTNVQGRWIQSLMLDPGSYVLVFWKQGAYGPDTAAVTVS